MPKDLEKEKRFKFPSWPGRPEVPKKKEQIEEEKSPEDALEQPAPVEEERKPLPSTTSVTDEPEEVETLTDQEEEEVHEIESILSENLEELYEQMTPQLQEQFKVEGEATARKIHGLLQKTKIRFKEIIGLIKQWLTMIPGVNKFFLEQETKIKTEKVIDTKNKDQI